MGNDEPSFGLFDDDGAYAREWRRRNDLLIDEVRHEVGEQPDFSERIETIARVISAHHGLWANALEVPERLAGRLYRLGHDPFDLSPLVTEDGLAAIAAITSTFPEERRGVAVSTNINNIVGWGRIDKTNAEFARAIGWKFVGERIGAVMTSIHTRRYMP